MAERLRVWGLAGWVLTACVSPAVTNGQLLDSIGITQLRQSQPGLTGTDVAVGLIEASTYTETPPDSGEFISNNDYQVSSSIAHGIPTTYINATGETAAAFPNTVGVVSAHADEVGKLFFGTGGVAPGVAGILNVEANYFLEHFVGGNVPANAKVINQSFGSEIEDATSRVLFEQMFDNYVVNQGVIVVSGAGNGSPIIFPASFMNGIAAGAYNGATSAGPTADGRSKPDLVAPGSFTSYSSPLVAGVAAVLVQAGQSGTGGAMISSVDPRTVKALLLTGAMKPGGWTHSETAPLDVNYGAGVVNAYTSHRVLAAGKRNPTATTHTGSIGGDHDAVNSGTAYGAQGWNLKALANANPTSDAVDHYLLSLMGHNGMAFTATLTWYHPVSESVARGDEDYTISGLNNLDLYLYHADTNTRVAASRSLIDNVEHLHLPVLGAGRYDLQVLKNGRDPAGDGANWVSVSEMYALAWQANLLGDANIDGLVDAFDINILAANWQSSSRFWRDGDFTGDGFVDAFDLNALAANWQGGGLSLVAALEHYPVLAGAGAVPEPASLGVLGAGAVALLVRRRRIRA